MSESGIWVIDTSSIIEVRRLGTPIPQNRRKKIYSALGSMVESDELVFPREVYAELRRASGEIDGEDLPFDFVHAHRERASAKAPPPQVLREVLAIPGVDEVVDVNNPVRGGVEPADPYVVAMAWHLHNEGERVTVITEDRKQDRSDNQISLAIACGLAGIPDVPLLPFLASRGIWRRQ